MIRMVDQAGRQLAERQGPLQGGEREARVDATRELPANAAARVGVQEDASGLRIRGDRDPTGRVSYSFYRGTRRRG